MCIRDSPGGRYGTGRVWRGQRVRDTWDPSLERDRPQNKPRRECSWCTPPASLLRQAPWFVLFQHCPVSYTHLRAHETDSYLVCRLLLEKKKRQSVGDGK